jgi:hypothetical protein
MRFYRDDEKYGCNEYTLRIGLNQTWHDARVEQFVGSIQKIEIATPAGIRVIEGREKQLKYITKHRSRFSANVVHIAIRK